MAPTLTPARATFRALVADVAARATAVLPQAVNGRVESAVKLVLAHDVEPQADGSILVGSSSEPLKTYRLEGHSCTCQDFVHGKAPEGWCQHRIAAGIQKRVQELLPTSAPEPPESAAAAPSTPPQPGAALPEAPASVNCHLLIEGRQVQLTLRDTDETRLLQRLQAVLAQYPTAPVQPQTKGTPADGPQCPQHGPMKPSTKGRGHYCAHKLADGSWCKGR